MKYDLVMPKMGESITEATILKWHKQVGDVIDSDEIVLDIATDKVDSEIPSPYKGKIIEILYKSNEIVKVGEKIAVIEAEDISDNELPHIISPKNLTENSDGISVSESLAGTTTEGAKKFYSPLVKKIAQEENIGNDELAMIQGTGNEGRITKNDIKNYISDRLREDKTQIQHQKINEESNFQENSEIEIIEMDRMRKLISEHMVKSKQISPHVTSFIEADVTTIVNWRNKIKDDFLRKYNEKLTFTPIFINAVVKAIKEYPMINVSVEGDKIIKKNFINIGMAAALPTGNLIVPVIKNADSLNLVGITKKVNDLANRARQGKLSPDEIKDGTFTLTNVGTFGNVMGTPIINQPQVAILATGAIRKRPAVIETIDGDVIAIRHMMFLSLSYDHRVVDGSLGGSFLKKISDILESFNGNEVL